MSFLRDAPLSFSGGQCLSQRVWQRLDSARIVASQHRSFRGGVFIGARAFVAAANWRHSEQAMHAWVFRLEVLPEVIEYYLWDDTRESGPPLWAYCMALHGQDFP